MKIIRARHRVEATEYKLQWSTGVDRWLAFPCNKQGVVDVTKLHAIAAKNYADCVASGVAGNVRAFDASYWEPALGECDCGGKVSLSSGWANACPDCGAEYNGFGQRLAPREQWGEETGEVGDW
jgi:hypothetical protein